MPGFKLNMVNLNWVIEDIDLQYRPVKGPEILFRRTFNNDASTEGVFGRGWTHSYAIHVEEFPGQVQVVRGDGRIDTYVEPAAAYDAPLGVNDQLVKNPDGATRSISRRSCSTLRRRECSPHRRPQWQRRGDDYATTADELESRHRPGPGYFNAPAVSHRRLGNIYVVDTDNNRIQKFDASGTPLLAWGSIGITPGKFNWPADIAVDSLGNVNVVEVLTNRVQKFDASGTLLGAWGSYGTGNGQFAYPRGIAVDSTDFVYVLDTNNNRVQKFALGASSPWGSWDRNGAFFSLRGLRRRDIVYVAILITTVQHDERRLALVGAVSTANGCPGPSAVAVAPRMFCWTGTITASRTDAQGPICIVGAAGNEGNSICSVLWSTAPHPRQRSLPKHRKQPRPAPTLRAAFRSVRQAAAGASQRAIKP
jgi:hypothetical protein